MLGIDGELLASLVVGLFCSLMTLGLRIVPRLRCRDFGIDTWYFLAYARSLRRQRRWPVTMPYYLLDHPEQIYPPGLPWLLSWCRTQWLERSHWWISAAIDAVHCAILCSLVWVITHSWIAVGVAGLLFATSPVLVAQATELNARPLGALVFTVFMLSVRYFQEASGWLSVGAVLVTGMIILWTHKMTTQQMVVVLVALSLIYRDPRYLLLGLGMFGLSIAISRGWFLNVLKGHWEIVRFWRKHRPFLGSHQVYHSPLYSNPEKAARMRGVLGLRASPIHRWLAIGHLAMIASLVTWIGYLGLSSMSSFPTFFLNWTSFVFLTVFLTTVVPGLTQFGEGFKYFRYGVFPWSCLLGFWVQAQDGWLNWVIVGVLAGTQLLVTLYIVRAQRQNYIAAIDGDTRAVLLELARQPEDGVLALPSSRSEAIAYFSEKQVVWGAHGRGWDRLEPFWPVFRKPIEAFFDEYKIHWLWLDTRHVDVEDLRLSSSGLEPWLSRGPIRLFRYDPGRIVSTMTVDSGKSTAC